MQITSHDALVVVDMQIDFCPGGALPVPDGDAVVHVIQRIAPRFDHVLLTQDWHPPEHCSFASTYPGLEPFDVLPWEPEQRVWPDHCVQGTRGAEFHPSLHLPHAELILRKGFRKNIDSYSAFFENDRTTATGLTAYCRERGFERLFFAGLAYDFCVGYSALDARSTGFSSVVVRNACRAIDVDGSVEAVETEFARQNVLLVEAAGQELIPIGQDRAPARQGRDEGFARRTA